MAGYMFGGVLNDAIDFSIRGDVAAIVPRTQRSA
jgi:hypothetical protein